MVGGYRDPKPTYKQFDYTTDGDYYWISALCSNCKDHSQIAILKGKKINSSRLLLMKCTRCKVVGTLHQAIWNGQMYVKIK